MIGKYKKQKARKADKLYILSRIFSQTFHNMNERVHFRKKIHKVQKNNDTIVTNLV